MAKLFNEQGDQIILSSRNVADLEKIQKTLRKKEATKD